MTKRISLDKLSPVLERLPAHPRIVTSGNFATPKTLLNALDAQVETYTLHALNAQKGIPSRPGVTHETTFVGAGMRGPDTVYVPCRLSLVPTLYHSVLGVDAVVINVSPKQGGKYSLGVRTSSWFRVF